jgi:hypothetical protein
MFQSASGRSPRNLSVTIKKLRFVGSVLLCLALGIACAMLLRSYLLQLNDRIWQLNDPWKANAPAYARQGYSGKQRVFTKLTPAQLTNTLERLSPQGVKRWLRTQPARWIAIGGKIERVSLTNDVKYPDIRVVLEQSKGNTELFFPLAADIRLPSAREAKVEAVCHIYGLESSTLILDDCWQIGP